MKYNPDIIKSNRKTVQLELRADGKLVVRAPKRMPYREIEEYVNSNEKWIERALSKHKTLYGEPLPVYTDEELAQITAFAKAIIPQRVEYYANLLGVTYGKISIRHPKTRWGSCSAEGNLSFSCLLSQMPLEVLDSVVVHELCHRKHMNHSKRFYDEILRVMPDYFEREKWLKSNGKRYSGRLP